MKNGLSDRCEFLEVSTIRGMKCPYCQIDLALPPGQMVKCYSCGQAVGMAGLPVAAPAFIRDPLPPPLPSQPTSSDAVFVGVLKALFRSGRFLPAGWHWRKY